MKAKDYVIDDFDLDAANAASAEAKRKNKKKTAEYSVEFVSGPDFAVRRKTTKTESVFVCFASRNQFYVRDEKTGIPVKADDQEFRKFFADLPDEGLEIKDAEGNGLWWLSGNWKRGAAFADMAYAVLTDERFREYASKDYIRLSFEPGSIFYANGLPDLKEAKRTFDAMSVRYGREEIKAAVAAYAEWPTAPSKGQLKRFGNIPKASVLKLSALFGAFSESRRQVVTADGSFQLGSVIQELERRYGRCGTDEIMKAFVESETEEFFTDYVVMKLFYTESGGYGTNDLLLSKKREFELGRLTEYAFYESYRQGFADNASTFFTSWADTLDMEETVYGKVTDKYPEHLTSLHDKLAYKVRVAQQEIDEKAWAENVERMKKRRGSVRNYVVLSPETKGDMLDEAQAQSNCLASYVRNVIDGECMIFFLRRKSDPGKSYVTVEVRSDGTLGQVKAKSNRDPDPEAMDAVLKWHAKAFPEAGLRVAV